LSWGSSRVGAQAVLFAKHFGGEVASSCDPPTCGFLSAFMPIHLRNATVCLCSRGHEMQLEKLAGYRGWMNLRKCERCLSTIHRSKARFHCSTCNTNVCDECATGIRDSSKSRSPSESTSAPSRTVSQRSVRSGYSIHSELPEDSDDDTQRQDDDAAATPRERALERELAATKAALEKATLQSADTSLLPTSCLRKCTQEEFDSRLQHSQPSQEPTPISPLVAEAIARFKAPLQQSQCSPSSSRVSASQIQISPSSPQFKSATVHTSGTKRMHVSFASQVSFAPSP
jgi:hypothetical protein